MIIALSLGFALLSLGASLGFVLGAAMSAQKAADAEMRAWQAGYRFRECEKSVHWT